MTRFKAFKILLDKDDVLDQTNSIVFLSPTRKNFYIWQRALQGDRAIVVSTKPSVRIILATIKNKGLSTNANPFAVGKKSLIIYLSTEGVVANTTVNFSQLPKAWTICPPIRKT
jgi:hypothetical protein